MIRFMVALAGLALLAAVPEATEATTFGGTGAAVNLSLKAVPASEVSRLVSQQAGVRFAFIPSDPSEPMTVELKDVSATQLVEVFGAFGGAGLARPREGKQGVKQLEITLRAKSISTGDLAQLLADLAGDEVSFQPADRSERVSLEIKDLSIRDLQKALTGYGKIDVPTPAK